MTSWFIWYQHQNWFTTNYWCLLQRGVPTPLLHSMLSSDCSRLQVFLPTNFGRFPSGEYTEDAIMNTNNSTKIQQYSQSFYAMSNETRTSCLTKKRRRKISHCVFQKDPFILEKVKLKIPQKSFIWRRHPGTRRGVFIWAVARTSLMTMSMVLLHFPESGSEIVVLNLFYPAGEQFPVSVRMFRLLHSWGNISNIFLIQAFHQITRNLNLSKCSLKNMLVTML